MPSFVPYLLHTLFPPNVRRPTEIGAEVLIVLGTLGVVGALTKARKWGWLWREWITTVDHKRIGVMYLIAAILMLFRGGTDALMMRTALAAPTLHVIGPEEYNELFTTHGTIMIFFMAMPLIFALFNLVIPLMIGARDVAFPRLNAVSFWLFAFGAALFNLSFIVGGSPNAGWTAYPPYTELAFNPGPGVNYYLVSLLISGIGTTITGINFLVTVLRMRAPGMTLMRMPMFAWAALNTSALILFAFPPLTVALLMTLLDRLAGTAFFTLGRGGMAMMYVNLFWLFGHPEVYIVLLPALGVFSEVAATFSRKPLFGYASMVFSMTAIMVLSYGTWVHHFFTMGAGPAVNAFFGLSTMLIAIPTGVKIFNWILTMWGGRVRVTVPMLYLMGFIPTFVIGGATGVMLATVPVDYQLHNTYFLVAHFHQTLIGGTVFGLLAGLYYWWPKAFGYQLDERQGKWAFWLFFVGFWVTFTPQYLLGLAAMPRRMWTYPLGLGWHDLNVIATVGAFIMGAGFVVLVYNVVWSMRYGVRDVTGDPWDGRTLEWALPSPVPEYNFARIPVVAERDAWWAMKQRGQRLVWRPGDLRALELPRNTAYPFFLGGSFFILGFGLVFEWWIIALVGLAGVFAAMVYAWFDDDQHHAVSADTIRKTEAAFGRVQA
ncbi:MAG: cytochrome c oxidase subunit I [Actinomycetia bacterium]|nr:cytochrome c oxidase subunit I [Actinomycetes bacterium]